MASVLCYRVVDWSRHFERNRTKELKVMTWVPIPNKQDGDGYTELLDHPNGAAHFGAWVAIVQVASKCDPRGTLMRDDRSGVRRPHDAASLSRITRVPLFIIEEAVSRLLSIGWLEAFPLKNETDGETPQEDAAAPHVGATAPHVTAEAPQRDASSRARAIEQERTEEERRNKHTQDACAREEDNWIEDAWHRIRAVYPPHAVEEVNGQRAVMAACRRSELPRDKRFNLPSIRRDGTDDPDPRSLTVSGFVANVKAWIPSDRWRRGNVKNLFNFIESGQCLNPPPPSGRFGEDIRRTAGAHPGEARKAAFDPLAEEKEAS